MIINLKIALFFVFYCFFCSAEASQLVGGRCTIFFDANSNNESVNTLLEKYKSSSVQLCRNDEESRYYVYSAPYMTSKDVCFVRNIDAGVIKGDSYQSFSKDDSKNNEDEIHQLFSLSKSGYCEKNYSSYVPVRGVSYDEFKNILEFFKEHERKKKFIDLVGNKRDYEFSAENFKEFNAYFIRGELSLANIASISSRHEFNVRFVRYGKVEMDIVYYLNIMIGNDGKIVAQRFSKIP